MAQESEFVEIAMAAAEKIPGSTAERLVEVRRFSTK